MATALNRPNDTTPLQEQEDINDDYEESFASSDCFSRLFCFPWRRNNSNNIERVTLLQGGESKESWWVERLKKIKEFSELVAGPKWKTFMRRFSNGNKKQKAQFQYDPFSYALNFDGGLGVEDDDDASRVFSQRFASSGKNGLELTRDPPGFHLNH